MPTATAGFRLPMEAEGLKLLPHFPCDLNMQHGTFKHMDMLIGLACPLHFSAGAAQGHRCDCWEIWDLPGLVESSCSAQQYSPLCAGMTRGWEGIPAAPSAHRWHSRQSARGSQEKASQRSLYQEDTVLGHCPSWQAHAELHKSLKKNRKE